jgi:predicted DsbA family dithiol-disulfide isomerase
MLHSAEFDLRFRNQHHTGAGMKITYYLDVTSSWCFWAEPAWAELKARFAGQVEFHWKVSQIPVEALPHGKAQAEWFYRRSGTVMRSPFMLNADWLEPELLPCVAPNSVAEAAKDFQVTDDRVRLALAKAAVREGRKVGRWEVAVEVAASAGSIDKDALLKRAQSAEVRERVRASTAEFYAMQVTQRPAFLLENSIGDRAIFSGLAKAGAVAAAIEAMLADAAAYASYSAHFGDSPPPV